jgi:hypothetical protein
MCANPFMKGRTMTASELLFFSWMTAFSMGNADRVSPNAFCFIPKGILETRYFLAQGF